METREEENVGDSGDKLRRTLVGIVDYGAGNLRNVQRALAHAGARTMVSDSSQELGRAERLVLPGVGAFKPAMEALRRSGLADWIVSQAQRGTPVLGLCLGYQMLFERSDEFGPCEGLGMLKGSVQRLNPANLAVPHVGWNEVKFTRPHPLLEGLGKGEYFYFANSFYAAPSDESFVWGTTEYGMEFTSIAGRENVMGVQFHPEKSQSAGLRLLRNFVKMGGC